MTIFEILVQVLQAYIFTLLAALYVAGALADEHADRAPARSLPTPDQ